MSARIRYAKDHNGNLKSVRNLTSADGREFFVVLHSTQLEGTIYNALTDESVKFVTGKTAHDTKIRIKHELKELGVGFAEERRKTKTD